MPSIDDHTRGSSSCWADDSELGELPQPIEKIEGNTKTLTEFSYDDNDRMVKTISHFKIEKHRVPKAIAVRKQWKKYGHSVNDKPGPNPATTITAEEVTMQFVTVKDEEEEGEDIKKKMLDQAKGAVKCRLCKEDHWTKQCPYKDKLEPIRSQFMGEEKEEEGDGPSDPGAAGKAVGSVGSAGGGTKYIPPSLREGANKRGETMGPRGRDETATIRVTNLSENTREQDLHELCRGLGEIVRIFLAKDKNTGVSKGFAFINFKKKESAEQAIQMLNGHGYDHLILSVEWAKPSGTQ